MCFIVTVSPKAARWRNRLPEFHSNSKSEPLSKPPQPFAQTWWHRPLPKSLPPKIAPWLPLWCIRFHTAMQFSMTPLLPLVHGANKNASQSRVCQHHDDFCHHLQHHHPHHHRHQHASTKGDKKEHVTHKQGQARTGTHKQGEAWTSTARHRQPWARTDKHTQAHTSTQKHRQARTGTKNHGQAQTSTDKHRQARASTDKQTITDWHRQARTSTSNRRKQVRTATNKHSLADLPDFHGI